MVPRQKAGHMTACHPIVQNIKKSLANRGRPHMSRCSELAILRSYREPLTMAKINYSCSCRKLDPKIFVMQVRRELAWNGRLQPRYGS